MKKVFSMVLCFAMILSLLTASAFAAGEPTVVMVCGISVDLSAESDVLGDGSVLYDPDINTLTIKQGGSGLTVFENPNGDSCYIYADGYLNVVFEDTMSLMETCDYCIYTEGDLSIYIPYCLYLMGAETAGISAGGNVEINGEYSSISIVSGGNGIDASGSVTVRGSLTDLYIEAENVGILADGNITLDCGDYIEIAETKIGMVSTDGDITIDVENGVVIDCTDAGIIANGEITILNEEEGEDEEVVIIGEESGAIAAKEFIGISAYFGFQNPVGGCLTYFDIEDEEWCSVVNETGEIANSVTLVPVDNKVVTLKGLDFDVELFVPNGSTVNDAYACLLVKEGYEDFGAYVKGAYEDLLGFYTTADGAEGTEFSFDDEITEDIEVFVLFPESDNGAGGSNNGGESGSTPEPTNPNTGDSILLWTALLGASATGMIFGKKRK